MMMDAENATLVMIDYQPRLLPAIRHGQKLVARSVTLGRIAALLDVPVIGTEQSPDKLGENVPSIRRLCSETLSKTRFDASDRLRATALAERGQVVLCGCEAHVCVLQTALGLQRLGFEVLVVEDAVGARREADKSAALQRLRQAGIGVVTLEMVAFEWLGDAQHPRFREVQALIK
ncbi:MAG TPA: isochorismatase family protein [Alcanivorax sp.]|nr:isochorismatase family protein [Alcanivorax sp.]